MWKHNFVGFFLRLCLALSISKSVYFVRPTTIFHHFTETQHCIRAFLSATDDTEIAVVALSSTHKIEKSYNRIYVFSVRQMPKSILYLIAATD